MRQIKLMTTVTKLGSLSARVTVRPKILDEGEWIGCGCDYSEKVKSGGKKWAALEGEVRTAISTALGKSKAEMEQIRSNGGWGEYNLRIIQVVNCKHVERISSKDFKL